jgi:hypothetical protein
MARSRGGPLLGIDFGTSNSAVSFLTADGAAGLVPLEGSATTMPTAVFFNTEQPGTHYGREAVALYLAGVEGRLLRSLKSLLGSSLVEEETAVGRGTLSFKAIIALFLGELRERAGRHLGAQPQRAVIGRPVHFVDEDAGRDARAQEVLAEAAAAAGFVEVSFELEPIAAALDYERRLQAESLVLVVDIGGGTSDFTVVRLGPKRIGKRNRAGDILATGGVHIGGTDYDRQLSLQRVMPLLGLHHIGASGREVPSGAFFDLASWHLIHRMYTAKKLREARELRSSYADTGCTTGCSRCSTSAWATCWRARSNAPRSSCRCTAGRPGSTWVWCRPACRRTWTRLAWRATWRPCWNGWRTAPRPAWQARACSQESWTRCTSLVVLPRCGLSRTRCGSAFRRRSWWKGTCSAASRRGCPMRCRAPLRAAAEARACSAARSSGRPRRSTARRAARPAGAARSLRSPPIRHGARRR